MEEVRTVEGIFHNNVFTTTEGEQISCVTYQYTRENVDGVLVVANIRRINPKDWLLFQYISLEGA